jgi:hydrogenase expression/formation protein HypD
MTLSLLSGRPASPEKLREELARLSEAISKSAEGLSLKLMEVCGTHTMAIRRHGIPALLPDSIRLLSGPGCPVCVTPVGYIDHAVELARLPEVTIATFGDLVRVPGSSTSLEKERARGARIEVVYSPLDALGLARKRPEEQIVFLGVGFETTAPGVASSIHQASREGLENYSVLSAHKLIPPAMRGLAASDDLDLDGFLCPGHVSAIIGGRAYDFLAADCGRACVVAGFEPLDILKSVLMLVDQVKRNRPTVEIQYRRVVRPEGNHKAREIMERVFEPADTRWRGLGSIPGSGLRVRSEHEAFDAARRFAVELPQPREPAGCICGKILSGVADPADCALFGNACTPASPVGACMVSSEGTCAAHYKYKGV